MSASDDTWHNVPSPSGEEQWTASKAERIIAACECAIGDVPTPSLFLRDTREQIMKDLAAMEGSPHKLLPHRRIVNMLDALAHLLVSRDKQEVIAVGYVPSTITLVLAQNGSADDLRGGEQHLKKLWKLLQDIRTERDKVTLCENVSEGTATDIFTSCYDFSAARVQKHFDKASKYSMLERLRGARKDSARQAPKKPTLSEVQWSFIDALIRLLEAYPTSITPIEKLKMMELASIANNILIRELQHKAEFLDDILKYYHDCKVNELDYTTFGRLTDKLLAVDTCIRRLLVLPFSGSLGHILDGDLNIERVCEPKQSFLNYDLAHDIDLERMMAVGITPVTHKEFVDTIIQENKAVKKRYAMNVHAECTLLAHFVDGGIEAYPFIGTSKLCCAGCWLFFEAYNEVVGKHITQPNNSTRLQQYRVRGSHSHSYPWAAPAFLLRNEVLNIMDGKAEMYFRGLRRNHPRSLSDTSVDSQMKLRILGRA